MTWLDNKVTCHSRFFGFIRISDGGCASLGGILCGFERARVDFRSRGCCLSLRGRFGSWWAAAAAAAANANATAAADGTGWRLPDDLYRRFADFSATFRYFTGCSRPTRDNNCPRRSFPRWLSSCRCWCCRWGWCCWCCSRRFGRRRLARRFQRRQFRNMRSSRRYPGQFRRAATSSTDRRCSSCLNSSRRFLRTGSLRFGFRFLFHFLLGGTTNSVGFSSSWNLHCLRFNCWKFWNCWNCWNCWNWRNCWLVLFWGWWITFRYISYWGCERITR